MIHHVEQEPWEFACDWDWEEYFEEIHKPPPVNTSWYEHRRAEFVALLERLRGAA